MSNSQNPEDPAERAAEAPATPAELTELTHQAESGDTIQATGLLPPTHWTDLAEQQNLDDDHDSAFGDTASSTESITSSILEYRTIHGRTYHSENVPGNAQYWGSNDEIQNEAMDIKDFADEHPGVEVIGTDISPIQPKWVPPNLKFEIEDCTSEWTFNPNTFDYVHMRYLVGSIMDWTALFKEAYATLKPGAWLESFEGSPHMISDDGTVPDKSAISQWGKFFEEGGKAIGRSFLVIDQGIQKKAMEEAGFVDIQEWDFKAPVGGWPRDKKQKDIGQWAQTALECDIEGYVLFIANVIVGWSREEILVYIAQLRREIRSGKHHAYFKVKAVWGRKPESL
ncbi:Phosphoethanolamine N-methyltransferase 3 [Cytospora mali]|uniref:Phosphoethanolamine N-methyltransferase 3 n=1 Tax=Cytospora mali TaxID=578113 RepID=A0A194UVY4_CYTMA|nr:Phosphoethanolamine N-methyltransferase 3 [Valsa mali var. pyri (nom. inval.)]